jgi:ABC-type glycerol-3-phosphate transport system substrate-binding protein
MIRFAPLVVPEAKGLDGKWYAMIRSTDDRLLYWNKEAFQEVGLDPEKPPATWDEFKQMAIRLTKRGGPNGYERIGFHTEHGQAHYHIFAWQNGGSFQTADGKKATLTLGPNQEALQWMADLMKDLGGWGPLEDFRKTFGSNAQDPFLTGQLAMQYQTNGSTPGNIARFRPDMKFGAAAPPVRKSGDKPLTWSGGFAFNMIKGSKKQDAAWELMKFITSVDWFKMQSRIELLIPSRVSLLDDWIQVIRDKFPSLQKVNLKAVKDQLTASPPQVSTWPQFLCAADANKMINDTLTEIFTEGSQKPSVFRDRKEQIDQAASSCGLVLK